MTTPVFTIDREVPASDALAQMTDAGVRHAVIVCGSAVVGVLSERDLGGARGGLVRRRCKVGDLMHRDPLAVSPETQLERAAILARDHHVGCLPVVERGTLVGIVTRGDLLAALAGAPRPTTRARHADVPHPPRFASPNREKRP